MMKTLRQSVDDQADEIINHAFAELGNKLNQHGVELYNLSRSASRYSDFVKAVQANPLLQLADRNLCLAMYDFLRQFRE